jgi:hypothetical protein
MMQLARRAVLVVVVLLASLGTATAECAWVLWVGPSEKNSGMRLIVSAFPRAEDCHVTLASTVQAARQKYADEGWASNPPGSGWYREPVQGQVQVKCLPDTIDPRGPKAR